MKHFQAIDGLRAWMAWWVVSQHILGFCGYSQLYGHNPIIKLLSLGGLAVIVFVIVSGFVIANLMIVKNEPYGRYISRRFLRIYPLYAVAILFSLVVRDAYADIVTQAPWADVHAASTLAAERQALLFHGLAHAVLIHGMIPNAVLQNALSSLLAPAWSLSLEWQFYLIAPLLMRILFSEKKAVRFFACAATLASVLLTFAASPSPSAQWHYPSFLPLVFGFFILGMATRVYLEYRSLSKIALPAMVGVINFGLYVSVYTNGNLATALIPLAIWAVTIAVSLTTRPANPVLAIPHGLLASPIAVKMGLWSYSTYLLHVPILVTALACAMAFGMSFSSSGMLIVLLFACPLLLLASWASYEFFEQRVMRWGMTRLSRPRPERILAKS